MDCSRSTIHLTIHSGHLDAPLRAILLRGIETELPTPHIEFRRQPGTRWSGSIHAAMIDAGCQLLGSSRHDDVYEAVYRIPSECSWLPGPAYVMFEAMGQIHFATNGLEAANEILAKVQPYLETVKVDEASLAINFATSGEQFPFPLVAPTWDEIRLNYPSAVRQQLEPLMCPPKSAEAGRIIVFNGAAGTGKTYAVRALARAWSSELLPFCVVDPEMFFSNPKYLLSLLRSGTPDAIMAELDMPPYSDAPDAKKPKLIILEDVDELIAIDAKTHWTQAVSRLLNLGDGMLGQVTDCYLLLTANNDLDKLQSAVIRPGRCRALVDFLPFSSQDAEAWLGERGAPVPQPPTRKTWSLAEMYDHLRTAAHAAPGT